ncbi:MAG: hypothetical protein WCC70_08820 [Candidatus Aquilonibacter sp.]
MNYVEWLRVRNALRIYAIVLGILIVIGLIVRISLAPQLNHDQYLIDRVSKEPGTKISRSVVDGVSRTTIVSPSDNTTITIDEKSDGGRIIHIVQPSSSHTNSSHASHVGSIGASDSISNGIETITVDTNSPVNVVIFLAFATFAGLIFATIFGGSFACENGHLEIACLKPVSRLRYGLGIVGVDVVGIVLAGAMTVVAAVICQTMFEVPHLDFSKLADPFTLLLIVLPFSWYAALNAATASLRRGAGAVVGFAWPIAFVIIALSSIPLGDTVVGQTFHTIFWSVSRIIPLTYLSGTHQGASTTPEGWSYTARTLAATGLMLIYGALAIVQWRRVEA